MRQQQSHRDGAVIDPHGEVTTRVWSPETLRQQIKSWPLLDSDTERLQRIRELDDELAESVETTTNIAVDGLLNSIARSLDPTTSVSLRATHLALGTSTGEPDSTDDELGNEVYRSVVGDGDVDNFDLLTSTFLSQTEANGHLRTELGLVSGQAQDAPLFTHAVLNPDQQVEKSSDMVLTIDYVLEFRRPRR